MEKLSYNLRYRSAGLSSKSESHPSLLSTISVIHGVFTSSKYMLYSSSIGSRVFITRKVCEKDEKKEEETRAALGKAQEEIRNYTDRKEAERKNTE